MVTLALCTLRDEGERVNLALVGLGLVVLTEESCFRVCSRALLPGPVPGTGPSGPEHAGTCTRGSQLEGEGVGSRGMFRNPSHLVHRVMFIIIVDP